MKKKTFLKVLITLSLITFLHLNTYAQNQSVKNLAGTGNRAYTGDGGQANEADLTRPGGVIVDASGNIYFTETSNATVRKIGVDGIITTVAGVAGKSDDSGDGGPATSANLDAPLGLALDSNGNLFIADAGNHKIRKVDSNGIITTFAGNGTIGDGGDSGKAVDAELNTPLHITVDNNGNVFISDWLNDKIRKVDSNGIITTYAGTGIEITGFSGDNGLAINAEINKPVGIVADATGNIYFSDKKNSRIRKVDTNGIITTVAGIGPLDPFDPSDSFGGDGGLAVNAQLDDPSGVAIDSKGNLYIAESNNHRIRKITAIDGIINTIIGTGKVGFFGGGYNGDGMAGTDTLLNQPASVAVNSKGDVFFSDDANHRIRLLSTTTTLGIEDLKLKGVNIFVNENRIRVKSKTLLSTIELFDIAGKKILEKQINDTELSFDISDITSGIYIVRLYGENLVDSFKFAKN